MLLVLFVCFLTIGITGGLVYRRYLKNSGTDPKHTSDKADKKGDSSGYVMALAFVFSAVTMLLIFGALAILLNAKVSTTKIQAFEQENTMVKNSISTTVKNYMKFEEKTYSGLSVTDMKTEDIVALVGLVPSLSSDKLIQSQLDTIIGNGKQIRELKQSQIDAKQTAWWLYFGSTT